MIPMTPDSRPARDPRASAHTRFSAACACALLFLASVFVLFKAHASLASVSSSSQDSNSKPAPSAQQAAPTPSQPATPKDSPPLKKAVREKKVLTEDDLAKPAAPIALNNLDEGEENNSICDLSCEAALKAELGFTRERELEFRTQLTIARNEISNDHAWNSALQSGTTAAGQYCDLQRQKAEILSKGDASGYARDMVNSRYATRERDLTSQYRNFKGLVDQRIAAVQRFARLRGSVMQYEWNDFVNRACPDFRLP
ncbi:MAG TPA: hypothetical protein VE263_01140 [Candidatus Angelobacter sp.]|nr:hypothetical protein [Candidatus Angelobacter sp.]